MAKLASILGKERTIAGPGFNRWLVPPAALLIHLSIGMAYGFSVFWLPLSRALGVSKPIECPHDAGFFARLFLSDCDWKVSALGWMFTLFFLFLGSSAAVFGHWLEREGPRKAGVVAAFFWGGGFFLSALGVYKHQILLLWLGSGIIGGCGLGLGYISPVSTLIKWFPDMRGMATGMAIMGFGGGAMIGAPLADLLMKHYATPTSVGVWQTFLTLGALYFVVMLCGAFGYRLPPPAWKPAGWTPPVENKNPMVTRHYVKLGLVHKTPQFWLIWMVLCMNVSAGIGVIGMASPMLQEVFGGRLIGVSTSAGPLSGNQTALLASIGAGFAGLLSFFNIVGRIFWASLSDYLGRKRTYLVFTLFGMILYALSPRAGQTGSVALFVALFCVILTMYGGGFATVPAYLADLFGTQYVGAIHGRLLTAWSTAGILGPILVNYIREYQIEHGVPKQAAYNVTMYALAALLLIGCICNALVRPVAPRFLTTPPESTPNPAPQSDAPPQPESISTPPSAASWAAVAIAWTVVALPLAWALGKTLQKAAVLFH